MNFKEFMQGLEQRQFPMRFPGHWIGNEWHTDPKMPAIKESFNPSRDERLMEVRLDKNVVGLAIDSSFEARRRLETSFAERIEIIQKFRQALSDYEKHAVLALRIGVGKPAWEAQADIDSSLKTLDQLLANPGATEKALLGPVATLHPHHHFTLQPLGVTLAFMPFSTPFASFVQDFTAAILAGCPLLVMSSAHAVLSAMHFAYVCESLDLPKGVINIVFGSFTYFKQALQDSRIKAVIYTGSREHCDTIRKESRPMIERPLLLHSGGKNALVVHSSADIQKAVRCVIFGAFKSAGQLCTSTSRVFVHRGILPEFKEALNQAARSIKIGPTDLDGDDPFMGPLYSAKAVDKFLRFQTMAKREASETVMWGKAYEADTEGYFVYPGVHYIKNFDNSKAYQSNVLMSPDVAIYDYENLDDAIKNINATDAPLVVSFVGDREVLTKRRDLFLAPNLVVNLPTVEIEAQLPVTGRLQCGHHRVAGIGLAFFLTYPQSLADGTGLDKIFNAWPWPQN